MAYVPSTRTNTEALSLGQYLRTLRDAFVENVRRTRAYRETYRQLNDMNDRELADIGITRFMIADVAAQAADRN